MLWVERPEITRRVEQSSGRIEMSFVQTRSSIFSKRKRKHKEGLTLNTETSKSSFPEDMASLGLSRLIL